MRVREYGKGGRCRIGVRKAEGNEQARRIRKFIKPKAREGREMALGKEKTTFGQDRGKLQAERTDPGAFVRMTQLGPHSGTQESLREHSPRST